MRNLLPLLCLITVGRLGAAPDAQPPVPFPALPEWAQAGVTGGIPADSPVIATLRPGADLQAAIDAAPAVGGTIFLTEGDYRLEQTLRMRSGIVLRGKDRVTTRLVLAMRGRRPTREDADDFKAWSLGVLFDGTARSGLDQLTIMYDPVVPAPPDPRTTNNAYADNPAGFPHLHVVSVWLHSANDCWISNSLILNSGSHPLVIDGCRHVTVSETVVEGAHNRGPGSGLLRILRSESSLLTGLRVKDINTLVLEGGSTGAPCHGNVIELSRFEIDVRLHGRRTVDNLFEQCAIAVPTWLHRPPLSPGNAEAREVPPGSGNLLYLCTVTRDYGFGERAFSMADDPNLVYEVLETHARERAPSVFVHGPAPLSGSLRRLP